MMNFSMRKTILVVAICLVGLLFTVPNFLPSKVLGSMPSFLPNKTVNLGLDLRGGSYLLLEVDVNAVIDQDLEDLVDQIRTALREKKIGYTGLGVTNHRIGLNLRDPNDGDTAVKAIRDLAQPVQQSILGGNAGSNIQVDRTNDHISVSLTEAAVSERSRNAVAQSIEVIRRRVDPTGTKEPTIQRQGENRIMLQLPGEQNPSHIKDILLTTAKLTFRFVDPSMTVEQAKATHVPPGDEILPSAEEGQSGVEWLVRKRVMVSGENLKTARAGFEQQTNRPIVVIDFDSIGGRRFADATRDNVGKLFAIVLDNKVISAPRIDEPILGGSAQISRQLHGAADPGSGASVARGRVAGADDKSFRSAPSVRISVRIRSRKARSPAIIGAALVVLFMMVVYGFFGFLANLALIVNMILIFGALSASPGHADPAGHCRYRADDRHGGRRQRADL